jgi:hypothetical protein
MPLKAYVDSLPTCGRATIPAGSLQRLQHDAQALVLDRAKWPFRLRDSRARRPAPGYECLGRHRGHPDGNRPRPFSAAHPVRTAFWSGYFSPGGTRLG